jgi:putative ABC transport system permease protein
MTDNWRLAWRNLWRNRRRTWLTVGAMVFSNVLLVFMIALQLGSYDMMIENTLRAYSGYMQVQHRQYQDEPKLRHSIPRVEELAASLRKDLGLAAVSARASAFALASSEQRSFGIQINGVQPGYEPLVSSLPGLIRQGHWFDPEAEAEIILGSVLARNLKVGLGGEVTFIGSGRDGSFAAGIATVTGILHSGLPQVDQVVAMVPLAYFDAVFSMQGQGNNIVFELAELEQVPVYQQQAKALLADRTDLVVLDWDALQPGLQQAIRADMTSAWFIYGVLIVLVAFSVLNTQLMSVLERTREFGVMLALGISPGRLGRVVLLETLLMSLLGLVIGIALGYLLCSWLTDVGITMPGMKEMGERFNLPDRMYPQVSLLAMVWGPLTVFLGSMLAAIYPALRLLRLQPVTAMRAV